MSFVLLFLARVSTAHPSSAYSSLRNYSPLLFDLHELFNDTTLMPKMLRREKEFLPIRTKILSDTSWY